MDKLVVLIALIMLIVIVLHHFAAKKQKNKNVVITTMWNFQGLSCNEQVFTKNTYVFIFLLIYIHH